MIGLPRAINRLLLFLIALDAALSVLAIALPDIWFRLIHDQPYIDPQGLLRRARAVWAAFTARASPGLGSVASAALLASGRR